MKETNKSLWAGLAVLIATVAVVAIAGLLAAKPQKEMITGEADASEYRVSNMVPGHIDTIYVHEGARVRKGDTLAHIASAQVDAKMLQAEAARSAASAQAARPRAAPDASRWRWPDRCGRRPRRPRRSTARATSA